MTQASTGHRVLVTGSAGAVGRPVCEELIRRGHHVRGFDRHASTVLGDGVTGNVADGAAVRSAMDGIDTIVHLAANPHGSATFMDGLLEPNVIGLFNVMDAARDLGVRRVVLASTLQVVSGLRTNDEPRGTDDAAPTNHYALTKRWAEQMGEMYARVHGLSVICGRICWMPRNPEEADRLANSKRIGGLYVSPHDVGRFFACAVEAEGIDFAILYCAGPPDEEGPHYDLEPGRRLIGYQPRDTFPAGLGFEWSGQDRG